MLKLKSLPIDRSYIRSRKIWLILLVISGMGFQFIKQYQNISHYPASSWTLAPVADCAVVLTGGPGRVREGFDLLANHQVKKLIISGVFTNTKLHDLLPIWTLYGDLNEEDVVLERKSESTYGNAQQSQPIVEALRCRDFILVTSRIHMYRAYQTFRAVFPEHVEIHQHAIVAGRYQAPFWEVFVEASKTLFYSIWAF